MLIFKEREREIERGGGLGFAEERPWIERNCQQSFSRLWSFKDSDCAQISSRLLYGEENSDNLQLGDRLMKAVPPVIALNGITYFQITSVGSHSTLGKQRKRGGRWWYQ